MPPQTCDNDFIVEFIGRHSLMAVDGGWTWKFDGAAMGARRFGEPFREYLQAVRCRAALIFGEKSALVSRNTASYMSQLMGQLAPIAAPSNFQVQPSSAGISECRPMNSTRKSLSQGCGGIRRKRARPSSNVG